MMKTPQSRVAASLRRDDKMDGIEQIKNRARSSQSSGPQQIIVGSSFVQGPDDQ